MEVDNLITNFLIPEIFGIGSSELEQRLSSRSVGSVLADRIYQLGGTPMIEVLAQLEDVSHFEDLMNALASAKQFLPAVKKAILDQVVDGEFVPVDEDMDARSVALKLQSLRTDYQVNMLTISPSGPLVRTWKDSTMEIIEPRSHFKLPNIHLVNEEKVVIVPGDKTQVVISVLAGALIDKGVVNTHSLSKINLSAETFRDAFHKHRVHGCPSSFELDRVIQENLASYLLVNEVKVSKTFSLPPASEEYKHSLTKVEPFFFAAEKHFETYLDIRNMMSSNVSYVPFPSSELEKCRAFRDHELIRSYGKDTASCLSMFCPGVSTIAKYTAALLYVVEFMYSGVAYGHSSKNNWQNLLVQFGIKLVAGDIMKHNDNEFDVPAIVKDLNHFMIEDEDYSSYNENTGIFREVSDAGFRMRYDSFVGIVPSGKRNRNVLVSDVHLIGPEYCTSYKGVEYEHALLAYIHKLSTELDKGTIVVAKFVPKNTGMHEGNYDWYYYLKQLLNGRYFNVFSDGRMHNGEIVLVISHTMLKDDMFYGNYDIVNKMLRMVETRMHYANYFRNLLLVYGIPCLQTATPATKFALHFVTDISLGTFLNTSSVKYMENVVNLPNMEKFELQLDENLDPSWADQADVYEEIERLVPVSYKYIIPSSFPSNLQTKNYTVPVPVPKSKEKNNKGSIKNKIKNKGDHGDRKHPKQLDLVSSLGNQDSVPSEPPDIKMKHVLGKKSDKLSGRDRKHSRIKETVTYDVMGRKHIKKVNS